MIPLAVSLTGLQFPTHTVVDASPRGLIAWAAAARRLRPDALVLDATLPGLRPRELDRSARRDLATIIRRSGLAFAGLDLFIPPQHFADPVHSDRALAAVLSSLELAADLARVAGLFATQLRPWVTSDLGDSPNDELQSRISNAAHHVGTTFAALAPAASPPSSPTPVGAVALDPAALILRGTDPVERALSLSASLAAPRVSDAASCVRRVLGQGQLDIIAYKAAIARAPAVACLDLRQLLDAPAALDAALAAWHANHDSNLH